ncbi:hypothetical protein [Bradyrhizobium tropiciagri]|uniref:hypothetical protein n=1 Tax=Bradyrhizobium tropiciagri TaxID=312253 RepID=UPI0012FF1CF5|nr:hypothetical protein [Bradyrhizobium tropiciagri]
MDCFVAGAPRNDDGVAAAALPRNTLFTIRVDLLFTTFMRCAFTNARDAMREGVAIA